LALATVQQAYIRVQVDRERRAVDNPERLQAAGVSRQVYQETDNYDDNALAWFKQYHRGRLMSPD